MICFTYGITFHACNVDLNSLRRRLKHMLQANECFECKNMNEDKYHLLVTGHKYKTVCANIEIIWKSQI